ncbi:flagellar hook capping FlgD N-terminal domain-containing protein [Histidinibacterium aquaticum]|uniref:Basal-body rod modification protein FlgD n=1 Tax=Histidinibacterium aquaticum TaxID=2613962 RepID=A0A5J5GG26_9RHOB|nr:flagellar hook capping FlgD N-terminal domain-containing protein [Histidinibacterium aquaticum]KAA9006728.1 flagellar basal body rod modification protein [Histidinibacterium aquaticum]
MRRREPTRTSPPPTRPFDPTLRSISASREILMETTQPTNPNDAVREALASSGAKVPPSDGDSSPAISSDFETFLRMLTVQMENQDPLNPVDSAEYAVQLATFSGVEQQVMTNDLLRGLTDQFGVSGLNQVADWVGQRARVTAAVLPPEEPMTIVAETAAVADGAELIVKAGDGTVLERHRIQPPGGEVAWTPFAGSGAARQPVTFEVESFSGGTSLGASPAPAYVPVREVRIEEGAAVIVLPGGETVPATSVTALREG